MPSLPAVVQSSPESFSASQEAAPAACHAAGAGQSDRAACFNCIAVRAGCRNSAELGTSGVDQVAWVFKAAAAELAIALPPNEAAASGAGG